MKFRITIVLFDYPRQVWILKQKLSGPKITDSSSGDVSLSHAEEGH